VTTGSHAAPEKAPRHHGLDSSRSRTTELDFLP
jgi:hypothetical protein